MQDYSPGARTPDSHTVTASLRSLAIAMPTRDAHERANAPRTASPQRALIAGHTRAGRGSTLPGIGGNSLRRSDPWRTSPAGRIVVHSQHYDCGAPASPIYWRVMGETAPTLGRPARPAVRTCAVLAWERYGDLAVRARRRAEPNALRPRSRGWQPLRVPCASNMPTHVGLARPAHDERAHREAVPQWSPTGFSSTSRRLRTSSRPARSASRAVCATSWRPDPIQGRAQLAAL